LVLDGIEKRVHLFLVVPAFAHRRFLEQNRADVVRGQPTAAIERGRDDPQIGINLVLVIPRWPIGGFPKRRLRTASALNSRSMTCPHTAVTPAASGNKHQAGRLNPGWW
jgi:hypothetical protein